VVGVTLLDRHIARRFLGNWLALIVALFAFVVTVDLFLNLKRFLRAARALDPDGSGVKTAAATALAVIDLWGPRLLQLFNHLGGLVLVLAAGFTAASLVRKRELVAALASGLSLQRLSAPIFAGALAVTALQAINQEYVLPRVAHLLPRDAGDVGQRRLESFGVPLLRDGAGRLWRARAFDPASNRLEGVVVWERDERGRVTRRISADAADWTGDAWRFEGGVAQRPGQAGAAGRAEPVAELATDLAPTLILVRRVEGFGQSLSWRQIRAALAQRSAPLDDATRRELTRTAFGRVSFMLSNLCVLAIAMPFFMTRAPVNLAARSLRASPIVAVGLIGSVVGVTNPLPGLPVALAVFFPALVLAPIALVRLAGMRT